VESNHSSVHAASISFLKDSTSPSSCQETIIGKVGFLLLIIFLAQSYNAEGMHRPQQLEMRDSTSQSLVPTGDYRTPEGF
jgi:hypothetical protein